MFEVDSWLETSVSRKNTDSHVFGVLNYFLFTIGQDQQFCVFPLFTLLTRFDVILELNFRKLANEINLPKKNVIVKVTIEVFCTI